MVQGVESRWIFTGAGTNQTRLNSKAVILRSAVLALRKYDGTPMPETTGAQSASSACQRGASLRGKKPSAHISCVELLVHATGPGKR